MSTAKFILNLLCCITIIFCNMYISIKILEDDKIVNKIDSKGLKNKLLKDNLYQRCTYIINTILVCACLITLLVTTDNIVDYIIYISCVSYALTRLLLIYKLIKRPSECQKSLILYWSTKLVNELEVSDLNNKDRREVFFRELCRICEKNNINKSKLKLAINDLKYEVEGIIDIY